MQHIGTAVDDKLRTSFHHGSHTLAGYVVMCICNIASKPSNRKLCTRINLVILTVNPYKCYTELP